MLDDAINLTMRGFGNTITDVLTVSPKVSLHLKNYIATTMKDDRKENALRLLEELEKQARLNAHSNRHFSLDNVNGDENEIDFSAPWAIDKTWLVARNFKIHPIMIIALLVAFIFSLLQIPNLGLRIGNLLRNKFHLSRKAQVAVTEVFNFLSKVAKDVTQAFSNVIKYMTPVTPMLSVTPFHDTIINLSQDYNTKSAFRNVCAKLDPWDKKIIDSMTTGLPRSASFSQRDTVNFARMPSEVNSVNFARMPFNPQLRSQQQIEQGDTSDIDEILTAIRVITQMLAYPGIGQIVMIFASQFIPITQLTVLLGGALVGAGGALATKGIDSVQRLRDQMVAYNSL